MQNALPDLLWTREAASPRGVVVTNSDTASAAGARVLERGGNAVDAAITAAFVLGVTSPGSAGLGGQTYILLHLPDGRDLAIDGSCRAPAGLRPDEMHETRDQYGSYYGYTSIATPGTLAAMALALERFGTLTLAEAIAPAIEAAETGAPWSPALRAFLGKYYWALLDSPTLSSLFLRDGIEAWGEQHSYCNPDLACLLRRLADRGAADFYRGAIAAGMAADIAANGGWVRGGDLALMQAEIREPVRGRYRGFDVVSFPSPGRGAAVVEALGILDRFPSDLLAADSPDRLHLLVEACRLAHADSTPLQRPVRAPDDLAADAAYVGARAALIRLDRALTQHEISSTPLSTLAAGGTTQISVADDAGTVVSLSQTLGNTFGALVGTAGYGFPYNNLISGFELDDPRRWRYARPFQAPMTGMAPTILLKDGAPYLAVGSAGSDRILSIVVNIVSNLVDRRLPLCEAVTAARAIWGGMPGDTAAFELVDPITAADADTLRARGFTTRLRTYPADSLALTEFGGANAIVVAPDGTVTGAGDPRRQGIPIAARPFPPPPAPELTFPACWRELYAASPSAPRR